MGDALSKASGSPRHLSNKSLASRCYLMNLLTSIDFCRFAGVRSTLRISGPARQLVDQVRELAEQRL